MLMYSNEIQIPLNIQRALYYFQNDKLLSLAHCYRSIRVSYMLRSTPSIIHFPLCSGFLAPTRSPNDVLRAHRYIEPPATWKTRYILVHFVLPLVRLNQPIFFAQSYQFAYNCWKRNYSRTLSRDIIHPAVVLSDEDIERYCNKFIL